MESPFVFILFSLNRNHQIQHAVNLFHIFKFFYPVVIAQSPFCLSPLVTFLMSDLKNQFP